MRVYRSGLVAASGYVAIVLAGQAAQPAAQSLPAGTRRPRGIYAVVVLDRGRRNAAVDLDALAGNSAVSGLAIRAFWSSFQPAKDQYDFSQLDAAFAAAARHHKTIQLILVPGFGTPSWVLDELPSCDELQPESAPQRGRGQRGGRGGRGGQGASPAGSCGKQSFSVSEGRRNGATEPLPLPWNPTYKQYWRTFLTEVAKRFGDNEAFVSIAVTGPTAESAEIIVPRAGDQLERWAQLLELSYRDASYHRTDKAFVEEWDAAVTMFSEVFRNVTLVMTRGSGLLNFSPGQGNDAQAAIVTAFAKHRVASNAKATQTSGMKACRATVGGIRGVKELAADGSLSPPVLGGAQFDTSFSQKPAAEGCSASCDANAPACRSVTPRDALANVLSVYFDGTPVGGAYGSAGGKAKMNYLQVYAADVTYAAAQPQVQSLLDQASQRLLSQAR
jgi:hypothetical protein